MRYSPLRTKFNQMSSLDLLKHARGFLSVRRPVRADVLIVESWLWDSLLRSAVDLYLEGSYRLIIVTGVYSKSGPHTPSKRTARRLVDMGAPEKAVKVAEERVSRFHNTATAGLALRRWLADHPSVRAVNIFTHGPHTRKTYTIFKRMLPRYVHIGILPPIPQRGTKKSRHRFGRSSLRGALYLMKNIMEYIYATLWPFP